MCITNTQWLGTSRDRFQYMFNRKGGNGIEGGELYSFGFLAVLLWLPTTTALTEQASHQPAVGYELCELVLADVILFMR